MKIFKKAIVLLIICLMVTVIEPTEFIHTTFTVEAHSGRTDSRGGHHDYRNKSGLGSYHYHHGYPAHLHPNGVCPYAGTFNSGTSSSSTNKSNYTTTTNINSNNIDSNNSVNSTQPIDDVTVSTIKISDTSYDNVAFNASYYANNNADVYQAYGDNAKALYDHFITCGIKEGRRSSTQFSIFVYKENNQDLVDAFGDDLIKYYDHFIAFGVNENRISK